MANKRKPVVPMPLLDQYLSEHSGFSPANKLVYYRAFLTLLKYTDHPFELARQEFDMCLVKMERDYKPGSRNAWVSKVRAWYKWRNGGEDYPECVRHVKQAKMPRMEEIVLEELLSESEIRAILRCADNPRDRALFAVLACCGFRRGAVLTLRIRDIIPQAYGYDIVFARGKTLTLEPPSLYGEFAKIIRVWLEHHPARDNPDSPLWLQRKGHKHESIRVHQVHKQLKRFATLAGVRIGSKGVSRVSVKWFRHTAATDCAKRHIPEAQLRKLFGWSPTSKMPTVYVHLAEGDARKSFLKAHGILKQEKEIEEFGTVKCAYCGEENASINKYCHFCGVSLVGEEVRTLDLTELRRKVEELERRIEKKI